MADQKLVYSLEGDASGLKKAMAEAESAYQKLNIELTRKAVANSALKVAEDDLKKLLASAAAAKQKLDFLKRGVEISPGNVKAFAKDIDQVGKSLEKLAPKIAAAQANITGLRGTDVAAGAGVKVAQEKLANADAQKRVEILRAQATETERVAAIERRRAADEAAATRAAQAGARVRVAAQQANLQSAQALGRLQAVVTSLPRFDMRGNMAAKLREVNAAAAQSKLALDNALTSARNFGRGGQSAAQGMTGQLKAMALQAVGAAAAFKGISAIIGSGIQSQRLDAKFQFASAGDTAKAAADLAFVRAEAERLALPIVEAADGFSKLAAATQGTSVEGEKTRVIFTGISSAMRVLGAPAHQVERAFTAVTQAISKGNLQAEEIRGQLAESIPGAFRILANALGITEQKLNKDLKGGLINGAEAMVKFGKELDRMSQSGLVAATQSFQAQTVRLGNALFDFRDTIAKAGLLDVLGAEITTLTEKLREMADTGELQAFAKDFAQVVSDIARILGTATRFAVEHRDAIANLLLLYGGFKIAKAVQGIEIAWAAATVRTVAAGAAITGVSSAARILLALLGGPVGIGAAILSAAAAWLIFREKATDALDATVKGLNGAGKALSQSILQFNAGGLAGDAAVSAAASNAQRLKKAYEEALKARAALAGKNVGLSTLDAADTDIKVGLKNLQQAGKFYAEAVKQRDQLAKGKPEVTLDTGKPKKAPADNTDRLGLKSIDAELAILKEALKESESLYDNALKNQEIRLEDSQAAKLAIIRRGFDAEIEANTKKLAILSSAKPKDANESRTFAADIADLQAKNVALGNEKAVREKLFADEAKRGAVELGKQADAFNADIELQLLRAQGQELAARLREIETARADALAKAGANGGLVNALFDAQGAIARADEIKRQIDAVFDRARQRADDIKNNAATGALPEQTARNAQIASAQQAAADAQPLIASLKQIIDSNPQAFGPAAQEQVDEYGRRLRDIGQVADEVATRINGSISSGFEKLFSDIGTSAATAQDALRTFVLGVVNEINAVVSKQLGQALFASLFPQGNEGGGIGGFFSSILGGKGGGKKGDSVANPLFVKDVAGGGGVGGAASALTVGKDGGKDGAGLFAGMFDEIGGFFSSLFARLKSALSSIVSSIGSALSGLFSGGGGGGGGGSNVGGWVSAIASAFGYADGGYTGAGGKYQPAGVVHAGEYVFNAESVRRLGLGALDNLHRIASGRFAPSAPRWGYAEGGPVNLPGAAAPTVNASTRIVNLFDMDSAVSEYLNTRGGERAILNIIQRNPGAVGG